MRSWPWPMRMMNWRPSSPMRWVTWSTGMPIRQLLQNSVAAGLIVIVTGDLGSAANLAAGVPAVLLNAAYTREFEREADEVAFTYLEARGINPKALGELLIRIDEQAGRHPGQTTLLDSHPSSRERPGGSPRALAIVYCTSRPMNARVAMQQAELPMVTLALEV